LATYGYLVYLLRANEPHRVRNLQRLSALGDADDDLLALLEDKLAQLGTKYVREEKSAEGYRIKSLKRRGRTLSVLINEGPQGSGGEAYNVETTSRSRPRPHRLCLARISTQLVRRNPAEGSGSASSYVPLAM